MGVSYLIWQLVHDSLLALDIYANAGDISSGVVRACVNVLIGSCIIVQINGRVVDLRKKGFNF